MTGTSEDQVLVKWYIGSKDPEAFGLLYDRHTPYLYRLALSLSGGDESVAQDLVHDAWVAAAPRFSRFRWEARFSTWLAGFVVNGARRARRTDRDAEGDERLELMGDGTEDVDLAGVVDRVDLERGIAALPARARHVFVLHDVEGWTHLEIARQLGIKPGTSKSQLSRARSLLRATLHSARNDQ